MRRIVSAVVACGWLLGLALAVRLLGGGTAARIGGALLVLLAAGGGAVAAVGLAQRRSA